MVKRYCPKCKLIFEKKSTYDYHMNRKFDCSPNTNTLNDINDKKNDNLNICENLQEFAKICEEQKSDQKSDQKSEQLNDEKNAKIPILIETHLADTNNMDNVNNLNNINDQSLYCSYCNKKYSSKYTLSRHLNDSCKAKKNSDNDKENIFKLLLEKDKENKENKERIDKLEKQNKILMNKIDKLINLKENTKSPKTINNISNTLNNNSNNTQNNYVIVNFGKEDLNIIDERLFIDRIIKKNTISGVKIPDEVLKIIHFNPMYPQLSNIYISDINREKCMVYDDGEWKLSNIDNIPLIMDKICLFSTDQINNLREKHPNNKGLNDRLNVIEKYNNMIDEDYIQDLKDDEDNYNKHMIERCENFKNLTYDTIKKTLYNEGKKIKKNIK